MDSLKLFKTKIDELENLPDKPKTFWYVSAGQDFRGLVFLSQFHIDHIKKHNGRELINPDLFVFNCLGFEVTQLREKLDNGEKTIYKDDHVVINVINYINLPLKEELIEKHVNTNHINFDHITYPEKGKEAFYLEVKITGKSYSEVKKLLYFEYENISFFNNVILQNFFEIMYLCNIREGCGFGGCKKSIIQHIYEDGAPLFYSDKGFKPLFNLLFTDFTSSIFKEIATKNSVFSAQNKYIRYYIKDKKITCNDNETKIEYYDDCEIFRIKYK